MERFQPPTECVFYAIRCEREWRTVVPGCLLGVLGKLAFSYDEMTRGHLALVAFEDEVGDEMRVECRQCEQP